LTLRTPRYAEIAEKIKSVAQETLRARPLERTKTSVGSLPLLSKPLAMQNERKWQMENGK
jgi:hypothetical protein